jgi:HEAT repeat protein
MRLQAAVALAVSAWLATPGLGQDTLGRYNDRSMDEWLTLMNDAMAHPDERHTAAVAVAYIVEGARPDHPEVLARIPALQSAIVDAGVNPEAGRGAAEALAHIGPGAREAVPALVDLIAAQGEYYQLFDFAQEAACEAVIGIGVADEPVLSALESRIRFRGPYYTGTTAVTALGRLAPPERAVPFLTETLDFGNEYHVLAAGRALAEIGAPARPALPKLLEAVGRGEETSWWQRLLGLLPGQTHPRESYFSSGPAAALLVLGERDIALGLLEHQVTSLEDAFTGRREAVESLWSARGAGFDQIGPLLMLALADESDLVRQQSLSVLKRLGPDAEPAFGAVAAAARNDADPFTRVSAVETLVAIAAGDVARLLPLLVELTGDAEYRVRGEAALQIGRLGRRAREARPALERLTADPDGWVQRRARWALGRLR